MAYLEEWTLMPSKVKEGCEVCRMLNIDPQARVSFAEINCFDTVRGL